MTEPITKYDVHREIRRVHGHHGQTLVGESLSAKHAGCYVALWRPNEGSAWWTVATGDTLESLLELLKKDETPGL